MNITFLGLGLMGLPMATNIATKYLSSKSSAHTLTVWNRTPDKAQGLRPTGVRIASSLHDAVIDADITITMVTAGADIEDILFAHGTASQMKKGSIVMDMSTIGPTCACQIAKKLHTYGIQFVDAPVTGSTPKAISGELSIFVGALDDVFTQVLPVLQTMGTNIHHMGAVGQGQAMKLVNNMIIAETLLAAAEGMMLADAMQLSRAKVAQVLKTVPAVSPFMNLKIPNFVNDTYPLLFSLANMTKDLHLALDEMRKGGKRLPYLERAIELHDRGIQMGLGAGDNSEIMQVMEHFASIDSR